MELTFFPRVLGELIGFQHAIGQRGLGQRLPQPLWNPLAQWVSPDASYPPLA